MLGCAAEAGSSDGVGATGDALGASVKDASSSWKAGAGAGTALRRAGDGTDIAVFYGGYGATIGASQDWADAVYDADLEARGIGILVAVKGPRESSYASHEIGNSKISAELIGDAGAAASRIVVIAHSSGAFVAHEMLQQLADGRDEAGHSKGKVVYFNLDGASGPNETARKHLAGAWAVSAKDASTGGTSTNAGVASGNGADYEAGGLGGHTVLSAPGGVCNPGANWCLHMFCTNTKPHNKGGLDVAEDYTEFSGHPVQAEYLSVLDK